MKKVDSKEIRQTFKIRRFSRQKNEIKKRRRRKETSTTIFLIVQLA